MYMPDPVRDNRWPFDSGCRDTDRSKFICCFDGREPKVNKVWILGEDDVTPRVHLTAQVDADAGVVWKFSTNYLTENGFKTSIFCKNLVMEVLSFSEFLIHWGLTGPTGLIISWFISQLGQSVVLWKFWTEEVNLAAATAVFASSGLVSSLPVLLTYLGVQKIRAPCPCQSPLR